MARETFEYAIRKDVRNNPIVREVDRERQQDLWRAVGVGAFLVLALLVYAWQHFDLLQHGYRLGDLQDDHAHESEINRHLRLERDTLRSPARIEPLATERLGMVRPDPRDVMVIERVAPVPPSASVLARR
jgi:cell division protein FtsL